jgi:hypothetical protein
MVKESSSVGCILALLSEIICGGEQNLRERLNGRAEVNLSLVETETSLRATVDAYARDRGLTSPRLLDALLDVAFGVLAVDSRDGEIDLEPLLMHVGDRLAIHNARSRLMRLPVRDLGTPS